MNRLPKILALGALLAAGVCQPAMAQSTAPPAQIGYLSTSGCSYGLTTCFVQYGATVPVSTTPSGTQDVNVVKVGGNAVTTTLPVSGTLTGITNPVGVKGLDGSTISGTTNPLAVQITAGSAVLGHVITDSGSVTTATLGAGSAIAGKVGIDQTTPGTTNGVQTLSGSTTAVTGTVAVTQSTSPWIMAGGGTAGTAATGVLTVQGIASMTKLLVTPDSVALPANQSVNVSQINAVTPLMGNGVTGTGSLRVTLASDTSTNTNPFYVQGGAANNASTAGNPLQQSCLAASAEPTLATNGQNASCFEDLAHKQIVMPYANKENFVSGTTAAMTGTTSTSLLAAPGSGLFNYVTQIACVNSHATVGTFVTVQDGSGGTALMTLAAASVFGGSSFTLPTPLKQPTSNTALYVADVTTGANVICSATGYKGS